MEISPWLAVVVPLCMAVSIIKLTAHDIVASGKPGLVLSNLDAAVHYFCCQGIAPSTCSTYQSVLRKFAEFCSLYSLMSPFPVSEPLACVQSRVGSGNSVGIHIIEAIKLTPV